MTTTVPRAINDVIERHNRPDVAVDEFELSTEFLKSVDDPKALSTEERRGAWAELAAMRFQPMRESGLAPWDSYFGPISFGTTKDGQAHYDPDASEIGLDVIEHWKRRSEEIHQPALRARYNDLVWEFCRLATDEKPELRFAQQAIDSYLTASERSVCRDEHQEWRLLDRALDLSLKLKDDVRTLRAKVALFAAYRRQKQAGPKFMWWKLDEIIQRRGLALDEGEQQELISELRERLDLHRDPSKPDLFDPYDAAAAAKRMAAIFSSRKEVLEARAAVLAGGDAFEKAAATGDGMLAMSWLQGVLRDYRHAGLLDDAARVEQAILARREDAERQMKRIEVPIDIKPEEYEKWLDQMTAGGVERAFATIAVKLMVRDKSTREQVRALAEGAPISARIPIDITGPTGFTASRIGSMDNDFEGRVLHHAANMLSYEASWLNGALVRAIERYSVTAQQIFDFVALSPFIPKTQHVLVLQGIEAWLVGDCVKAIHVLIPQVEAMLREILRKMGGTIMRPNSQTGGFEVLSMGNVLHSPQFRQVFDKDARLHLLALYCDPRGINLRTNVAHGLLTGDQFGRGIANWVLHSMLLLALLLPKEKSAS